MSCRTVTSYFLLKQNRHYYRRIYKPEHKCNSTKASYFKNCYF